MLRTITQRMALVTTLCSALLAVQADAAQYREEPVHLPIPVGVLAGTLTLPIGNGPFPVVLIVAGSGPTDRDGNSGAVVTVSAYAKLAHGLAERGIASLRYDKRGIGESTSSQAEKDLRFDDFVDDALALTAMLEKDPRFSSVSIIGHSEGSLIGTVATERDPHVRAFVSLEGPGRPLGTVIDGQVQANGAPPQIAAEVKRIDAELSAGRTVSDVGPQLAALFRPSVQPYLISEYRYDPAQELGKVTVPVLVVHGTSDIQVSDIDAERLLQADPRARSLLIKGMNHVLVDAPAERAANIAAYSEPELPLAPQLVPGIANFILAAGK